MAGILRDDPTKPSDLLFDLTVEDDKELSKSELLQLVNYGQLQKTVSVLGTDGKQYELDIALLWDEDHIDILRRTSSYAGDPLLRVRIMRRLKMHKAIQRINTIDFSDKADMSKQRILWNVLNKLSDQQMEHMNGLYEQIALERDMVTFKALKQLTEELNKTAPKDIRPKTDTEKVVALDQQGAEHEAFIVANAQKQEQNAVRITEVLGEKMGIDISDKVEIPKSPKQNPSESL